MTEQQFEGIVDAILAGKYSWACVLILQTAGYNPLHYIPYRTYNRLIKDNCLQKRPTATEKSGKVHTKQKTTKLRDLSYLEPAEQQASEMRGGLKISWFNASCANSERFLVQQVH